MEKFIMKSNIIEAIQLTRENYKDIVNKLLHENIFVCFMLDDNEITGIKLALEKDNYRIYFGDWLIKELDGTYSNKFDKQFNGTFEKISDFVKENTPNG